MSFFTFLFRAYVPYVWMIATRSAGSTSPTSWPGSFLQTFWINREQRQGGFSSHHHDASNYLPASLCSETSCWELKMEKKKGKRGRIYGKRGQTEWRGLWDCKRKREWKPSENPYTWFIPMRLCAVGRSYLLFMRASAAMRPDVKLCGDLI